MSTVQLDLAIQTLEDEHAIFLSNASGLHARSSARYAAAVQAREDAEAAETVAIGVPPQVEATRDETVPILATTEAERDLADTARANAWLAAQALGEATDTARIAAMAAGTIASGDVSRYTDWLRSTPVATGTLGFAFGDARPVTEASLALDFSSQAYAVWATEANHFIYE